MKANLFLTAIVFSTLPISTVQAHSSSTGSANWQNIVCGYKLQAMSDKDCRGVEARAIPTDRGKATIGLNYPEGNGNSQLDDRFQGTKLDPQAAINYNNRGVEKFRSGDNYGAIQDYDRALSINPKYSESYVNRGIAKFKVGNIQGAIQDYNRAIAIDPKDGEAYYNRGIARFESGEERSAIKDFDRAIAINPQDAEVYGNRGFAKSTIGDKKGAVADLTKAAKLFKQRGQAADAEKMQGLVRKLTTY